MSPSGVFALKAAAKYSKCATIPKGKLKVRSAARGILLTCRVLDAYDFFIIYVILSVL